MIVRTIVDAVLFIVAIAVAAVLATFPHNQCDLLTPLPWLRCGGL